MVDGWLRARAVLDRWFPVVVAVFVVLAGVGAWAAYGAYVAPGTTVEERTVDEWRVTGGFDHRATVTPPANGTAFEPGTTVENRSVYFTAVMPELEGSFTLGYGGEGPAAVRLDERVRVRSAEGTGDEEPTVYWKQSRALESGNATLQPGGRLRVPFSLNVTQAVVDAEAVNGRLGSPGQVQVDIVVDVVVDRQNGPAQNLSFVLPIRPEGSLYRVESGAREETFSRTERVTLREEPGAAGTVGGPVLAAAGVVGLAGLVVARRRGLVALSADERAWLDYRDDREDFDEWVTTVRLPDEARDLPVAEAGSLADLVDFAIDTDNAVMETPGERTFHVVHDGYRYTFTAPSVPASVRTDAPGPSGGRSEAGPDPGQAVDPESED